MEVKKGVKWSKIESHGCSLADGLCRLVNSHILIFYKPNLSVPFFSDELEDDACIELNVSVLRTIYIFDEDSSWGYNC